jgi:hypothetical protein
MTLILHSAYNNLFGADGSIFDNNILRECMDELNIAYVDEDVIIQIYAINNNALRIYNGMAKLPFVS